ncbi:MAG: AraC family transcriptional regulator [Marinobacterium sp.]|nr:AraC family transcriptional regulator [Marinobacterium sp.]
MDRQNPLIAFQDSEMESRRKLMLPQGVRLVEYHNEGEQLYYENTRFHTFSLYLKGGYETWRTDQQSTHGAPSHFCLMPKDAYSAWHVGGAQDFAHLYFSPDYLGRIALQTFDMDPRRLQLPQLIFKHDPALNAIFRHTMLGWDWCPDNLLAIEQGVQTLLTSLVRNLGASSQQPLTGGLAPWALRRVTDYIEAYLHRPLRLAELAQLVELSEYHFARMFRVNMAQTVQQYVTCRRIEKARQLLDHSEQSLAEIAFVCGFSSQSHFGRAFRQQTGISPGRWRKRR